MIMNIIHWIVQNVFAFVDTYFIFLTGMLLLSRNIHLFSKNILIPAIIYTANYLLMFHNGVPQEVIATVSLIFALVLMMIYLPANRKWVWIGWFGSMCSVIAAEAFYITILGAVSDVNLLTLKSDPDWSWLMTGALIIKAFIVWIIIRYRIVFFQKGDRPETRKKSFWLFSTMGLISAFYFFFFIFTQQISESYQLIQFSGFTLSLIFAFVLFVFYRRQELNEELLTMQQQQLDLVSVLFQTLRHERHDLVNHVHTIYGFVQARQMEHASDYLKTLVGDIRILNHVMVKDNPALSALLQVKMAECLRAGIDFLVETENNLNGVHWKTTEMNVVIGNLINNAIEAFKPAGEAQNIAERQIRFRTEVPADGIVRMTLWNNGPVIPAEHLQQLIENGFTTKTNHSGLGLSSVQLILARIHGTLSVTSTMEQGTCFQIDFSGIEDAKRIVNPDAAKDSAAGSSGEHHRSA